MTEYDVTIAERLSRAFPASEATPDWTSIRRATRPRRRIPVAAATLVLAVALGLLPALGVGRDFLGLWRSDEADYGYNVAVVETRAGRVEFRASRGLAMGLSVWVDGRRVAWGSMSDERLTGGDGAEGPRYIGFFAGSYAGGQYAVSPVAAEVRRVEVLLADGTKMAATIVPPPSSVNTELRFYYVVLPPRPRITHVRALDATGAVLEQHPPTR
jgi:hypothetical protein